MSILVEKLQLALKIQKPSEIYRLCSKIDRKPQYIAEVMNELSDTEKAMILEYYSKPGYSNLIGELIDEAFSGGNLELRIAAYKQLESMTLNDLS